MASTPERVPQRFLHCTYNGRTAICDGGELAKAEEVTAEDLQLPCCSICVLLDAHYRREHRAKRGVTAERGRS